jgi:hypothetical protein
MVSGMVTGGVTFTKTVTLEGSGTSRINGAVNFTSEGFSEVHDLWILCGNNETTCVNVSGGGILRIVNVNVSLNSPNSVATISTSARFKAVHSTITSSLVGWAIMVTQTPGSVTGSVDLTDSHVAGGTLGGIDLASQTALTLTGSGLGSSCQCGDVAVQEEDGVASVTVSNSSISGFTYGIRQMGNGGQLLVESSRIGGAFPLLLHSGGSQEIDRTLLWPFPDNAAVQIDNVSDDSMTLIGNWFKMTHSPGLPAPPEVAVFGGGSLPTIITASNSTTNPTASCQNCTFTPMTTF